MKTSSKLSSKFAFGALAVCIAMILQACGGGSSSTAGSASEVANGVVTGFGSVFVDGVELEDADAPVVNEKYDGSTESTVLQMGHRVRVAHNGKGKATTVTLDAAVIGKVSVKTADTLTVAGQVVKVVSTVTGTSRLTIWGGGYSSITDVLNGDVVEVHGTPIYDSNLKEYTVDATRISKVTTDSAGRMQVAGTISALNSTNKTFKINGLTVNYADAIFRPTGATLVDGAVVTAYAALTDLSDSTLKASHIKVNRLQDSSLSVSSAQIGGVISKYDATNKTFEVQGIKVFTNASTTINPNGKQLSDGAYVKISGSVGSDGTLTAINIQVQQQNTDSDLATVKLIGVISDYVDDTSFVVRGVPVDATSIKVADACPGRTTLAGYDGAVSVTAKQQTGTPVVKATTLSCNTISAVIIRPVDGNASNVDATAKTFTLTLTNATTTQAVQWNGNTTFWGVNVAELEKKDVRVEGYLSGSTLIARTVSLSSATGSGKFHLDGDAFTRVSKGLEEAKSKWNSYHHKK